MTPNVGGADRIIRIILGVVLLALVFLSPATLGGGALYWVALIAGLAMLLTGLFRFCGLYKILGINTCPTR